MKRFCMIMLAVWLLCAPVLAVDEIDIDFTGQIDSYTGEPAIGGNSYAENKVYLSDRISYDKTQRLFFYTVSGAGEGVTATVMDGMITTQPVSITVADGLSPTLYRDGEADVQPLSTIRNPGSYTLNLASADGGVVSLLSFTIVSETTGKLELYRMPEGFFVTNLLLNGEESDYDYSMVDFSEEGDYEVEYVCRDTGVTYHLQLTADHTPPTLTFSGVGEDGIARGPVSITNAGDAVSVTVLQDGEATRYSGELTDIGHYEVVAEDAAGNSVTYPFTIMLYLNATSIVFFVLLVVLLALLAVYLIRYRTRMRVR